MSFDVLTRSLAQAEERRRARQAERGGRDEDDD